MKPVVVIPAYNESTTIREVVVRALSQCDTIIVVDDGSQDGTAEQLDDIGVIVLQNERNLGKAASLKRGFDHALKMSCDPIITLDGDMQHLPEEIPRLIESYVDNPRNIVIAARIKQREQAPPLRRFANGFADFWVSWAAGYPVCDSQSGFRLYPSAALESININSSRDHSFVFESEMIIEAANHNFYSVSVAVDTIYREGARASHYQPWTDTSRIVRMIAGRLLRRGFYPGGLLKALRITTDPRH